MARSTALGSLVITFVWGVVAVGVGLNALVKSNQQKSKLQKAVAPIQLDINTDDVYKVGVVLAVVAALIAIVSLVSIILTFLCRKSSSFSRIQGAVLAFLGMGLLACQIPYTVFFATHEANVTAKLGSITIGKDAISQTEKALGVTGVYKDIYHLRLVAILPWITILVTLISAVLLFTTTSKTSTAPATTGTGSDEHDAAARKSEAVTNEKELANPATV